MEKNKRILVEIAYAKPEKQVILNVSVHPGETIEQVIRASGILQLFPEIDLSQQAVGIFSKPKNLKDRVEEGDRVEIYRPLAMDPKEARHKKVKSLRKARARKQSKR